MSSLGTCLSWTRDATLAGLLVSASLLGTPLALFVWIQEHLPRDLPLALAVVLGVGLGLGVLLGPLAWWAASSLWRQPVLALALGPLLGACCSYAAILATSWAWGGHPPSLSWARWGIQLGFGAFVATPPWLAYLAVRSRGRPGWPVVLGLPLWGSFSVVGFLALQGLRLWLGIRP